MIASLLRAIWRRQAIRTARIRVTAVAVAFEVKPFRPPAGG
jgi:hypothetical protein